MFVLFTYLLFFSTGLVYIIIHLIPFWDEVLLHYLPQHAQTFLLMHGIGLSLGPATLFALKEGLSRFGHICVKASSIFSVRALQIILYYHHTTCFLFQKLIDCSQEVTLSNSNNFKYMPNLLQNIFIFPSKNSFIERIMIADITTTTKLITLISRRWTLLRYKNPSFAEFSYTCAVRSKTRPL